MFIDISGTPVTSEEILAEQNLARKRARCSAYIGGACLAGIVAIFFVPPMLSFTAAGITVWLLGLAACMAAMIASEIGKVADTVLAPLAPSLCEEMVNLCNTSETARAYQKAVLAQGRQFIKAEYLFLRDSVPGHVWRKRQAAKCRELYEVPA